MVRPFQWRVDVNWNAAVVRRKVWRTAAKRRTVSMDWCTEHRGSIDTESENKIESLSRAVLCSATASPIVGASACSHATHAKFLRDRSFFPPRLPSTTVQSKYRPAASASQILGSF